ncbi:hypothetical protein AcW2_006810 [Taiwanofungus camphoratus]|nr:hypothetical protein AcW2_006810 [Antrodia cinnamomea]
MGADALIVTHGVRYYDHHGFTRPDETCMTHQYPYALEAWSSQSALFSNDLLGSLSAGSGGLATLVQPPGPAPASSLPVPQPLQTDQTRPNPSVRSPFRRSSFRKCTTDEFAPAKKCRFLQSM